MVNQNWKIFISFLKQNNLLDKYNEAIETQYPNLNSRIKHTKTRPVRNYVLASFLWDNTKEGFFFWEDISEKWANIVNSLKELFENQEGI
jgi:hypothetical protein